MTPTVSVSPLGNTQPYEPGTGPQSSSTRPCQSVPAGVGSSASMPRSTWSQTTPTCVAARLPDPSAPTTAPTVRVPSRVDSTTPLAVWSYAVTVTPVRSSTPAPVATRTSASSSWDRSTIGRKGGASRVNPARPAQVKVTRPTVSRESGARSTPATATAAWEAPIRPPPQRL